MFDAGQFQAVFDECRVRRGADRHEEAAEDAVNYFDSGDYRWCLFCLHRLSPAWDEFDTAVREAIRDAEEAAFVAENARFDAAVAEDQACPD